MLESMLVQPVPLVLQVQLDPLGQLAQQDQLVQLARFLCWQLRHLQQMEHCLL